MKILILTSADHLYSNYILKHLIQQGVFDKDQIIVFEQDSIIPKKTKIKGLLKYLRSAGIDYVFSQFLKVYLFKVLKMYSKIRNLQNSPYYPYYRNNLARFSRHLVNNIHRPQTIKRISKLKPDLILSVLSKEIIPNTILDIPKLGLVNLHPAYLPYYRGVSPTFWVLANNEKTSGVTLHYIDQKIDTGQIIARKRFSLKQIQTEHELYLKSVNEGLKLIRAYLRQISQNSIKVKTIKNPKKSSYFSLPTKEAVKRFRLNGYKFFKLKEFIF